MQPKTSCVGLRLQLCAAALIASLACNGSDSSGIQRPPLTETEPKGATRALWLEANDEGTVDVLHSCPSGAGPRLAELWIRAKNVKGVRSSEAGEAAERAGKQVHVQQKEDGLFRVIVMSSQNTSTIESGALASLELEREADGPMRVEILTDRPMFAPQEAQQGLTVGDPIEL